MLRSRWQSRSLKKNGAQFLGPNLLDDIDERFLRDLGLIYPRLMRVREVSMHIAARVIHVAQEEKVDRNTPLRRMDDDHLLEFARKRSWHPKVTSS